ncbi:hypothetical protein [Azospirillum aestuarii]|uniref:hypothetical protein n=1 Tax=Azospirillum aestuarii TaxID=2802052 RepID=UPI001647A29A
MPDTILRPAVDRLDPTVIAMNAAAARLGAAPADPLRFFRRRRGRRWIQAACQSPSNAITGRGAHGRVRVRADAACRRVALNMRKLLHSDAAPRNVRLRKVKEFNGLSLCAQSIRMMKSRSWRNW